MSEELIVRHCSPTLAGIKTGNIFGCTFSCIDEVKCGIRSLNKLLKKKGLRILPLKITENRALIYVYRPIKLCRDLKNKSARNILDKFGYSCEMPEQCIAHLKKRIGSSDDFPHEIGLFLGYPPEDVCGFIENHAKCCKYVGCWKVYGDVETAKKLFAKYKKCTDIYCARFAEGRSIERLTVAV